MGEPRQLWSWLHYYVQDSEVCRLAINQLAVAEATLHAIELHMCVVQEIYPSGEENGSAVTLGEYVRDVFLEQVRLVQADQ